jgi:5'-nucleotidase
MLLGVPSFAISNVSYSPKHFDSSARFAVKLAQWILRRGLPENTMLNVNTPDLPYDQLRGIAVTRMGRRDYQDEIVRREDPRGHIYYWIGGAEPSHIAEAGTDFEAIEKGKISVTPLGRNLTNLDAMKMFDHQRMTL